MTGWQFCSETAVGTCIIGGRGGYNKMKEALCSTQKFTIGSIADGTRVKALLWVLCPGKRSYQKIMNAIEYLSVLGELDKEPAIEEIKKQQEKNGYMSKFWGAIMRYPQHCVSAGNKFPQEMWHQYGHLVQKQELLQHPTWYFPPRHHLEALRSSYNEEASGSCG